MIMTCCSHHSAEPDPADSERLWLIDMMRGSRVLSGFGVTVEERRDLLAWTQGKTDYDSVCNGLKAVFEDKGLRLRDRKGRGRWHNANEAFMEPDTGLGSWKLMIGGASRVGLKQPMAQRKAGGPVNGKIILGMMIGTLLLLIFLSRRKVQSTRPRRKRRKKLNLPWKPLAWKRALLAEI